MSPVRTALAGLFVVALIATAPADDKKPMALGSIERKDPKFDELIPKDAVIEVLAGGFDWSEGPVWVKDKDGGHLLFSDIPKNKIWKWSEKGGLQDFLQPSGYTGTEKFTGKEPGSNGLALDKDGKLILCQHGDRRVSRLVDGKFVTLVDKFDGKRLNSPNDLAFKSNGDLYFTDPPYGLPDQMKDKRKELDFQGVYRLSPKGELTLLTKEMSRPNGIAFSPDEKTLYVANSDPDKAIWMAFPVKADGTLDAGKVFFDATQAVKDKKPGLPDGLKVDKAGNVFATGPGGVLVFDKDGKHLGTLATGVPTANCGWGDDGSTLYITADKQLVRVKTKTKGW
ncbi:MAG: SMP-30/gluconolactonase/LRE family protein [Fimbriiglobus sp.]|jgi:gluconolactonase|nr:SMP-30/gluconolactonase/LRE family protein [Fimbriiglobus sp.]